MCQCACDGTVEGKKANDSRCCVCPLCLPHFNFFNLCHNFSDHVHFLFRRHVLFSRRFLLVALQSQRQQHGLGGHVRGAALRDGLDATTGEQRRQRRGTRTEKGRERKRRSIGRASRILTTGRRKRDKKSGKRKHQTNKSVERLLSPSLCAPHVLCACPLAVLRVVCSDSECVCECDGSDLVDLTDGDEDAINE